MPELSFGELDALVLKAYRGAGFSWGMAQEAGRAASWLAQKDLPAGFYFSSLLQQIDSVDSRTLTPNVKVDDDTLKWMSAENALCPVICGTVLSDYGLESFFAGVKPLVLGAVCCPAILLPFIADCAVAMKANVEIKVDDSPALIDATGAVYPSDVEALAVPCAQVVVSESSNVLRPCTTNSSRADLSIEDEEFLSKLAHRTYVAASDESRLSGAGAGLTDND